MLEEPARGQRVAVRRESVVAFVGSSPRGPVGIPVAVRGVDEFRRRFGSPGYRSRIQEILAQFFDNGGTSAIIVRVSASERRHRIVMPGTGGDLALQAVNPGSQECLRASVDYDGIPVDDTGRFNLVIHRLPSRDKPIVEQQEIYRAVSVDPGDPDFVVHALSGSELARVAGPVPLTRPEITRYAGGDGGASYEYADDDWHDQLTLTDYDLIGCDTEGTGVFALDRVPIVDVVCLVPDAGEVGPVALFAAERYCQGRHGLLVIDPPSHWNSVADVVRDRLSSAFSSPNIATYFPRPAAGPGRLPSALGGLIGRLVAGDVEQGVWGMSKALNIRCRDRLTCALTDHDQAALKRVGINSLRECVGGYLQAAALVTMDSSSGFDAEWSDLRLRRLGLFIIGSIARGTRWAAFADDDEQTWDDVRRQISGFLRELQDLGALPKRSSGESWYVSRDPGLSSGPVRFMVGVALDGHEFMAFRFVHDHLDCRVCPVGWQPGVALAS